MNMQSVFEKQNYMVGWRGEEPSSSSEITLEYLNTLVDRLPRANMPDGDTLDGLDIEQLKIDFDIEKNNEQETIDRQAKYDEIEAYGLSGITGYVPDWDTLEDVKLIASIWNMFDTANITANQTSAKDIYLYAKDKMSLAMTGPIADVRAYDPTTDPSWPV